MAELGGMLAAAILKVVGNQIGSAIGGHITLRKNFDKELKKMKMALESIDAMLEDAEKRSITDKATLLWLKRLKDVLYAISDMIDEFEADTEAITEPSAWRFSFKHYLAIMIPCLTIGLKIKMSNKMETMMEDLEVITDQHKKFTLAKDTIANEPKVTDIRETTSIMETQIIGRTTEKEEILASLLESMQKDITILPIYGIGGLGKTTLAKMVYNSSQFKEYSPVWVYVSQTFDLMNIGNSIISQLSKEKKESAYTRMQMIHNSLQELLANKKILIVLDDLWEGDALNLKILTDMLKIGKGSNVVVIVTTRDEVIANKVTTNQPYKLAPLSDDMCWSIIKQKSAFESRGDKEQLEQIGKVIAMRCSGVALAANSIGHMLQSMKTTEWESVRDSKIWTVSSSAETSYSQVLASLKLSYSIMPSYLKLCFAYCAIFPKGHKIVKDDLIHQWVSLGFSTWQLGERYISQLLGLSFLEHSKSPSTIELYGEDITLLTMHDLVHDVARSVMDDEILVVGKGGNIEGSCYHYALVDDCSKPLGLESSKIRALRFVECDKVELHDDAFSLSKSLRVLDISECFIHKLPDSIGVLKQLRYLNAPRVQDTIFPDSISRLSKLIYLSLHGSSRILALPESIGEIGSLAYLDLSGCSGIGKLPESFARLNELVHLDFSNCSCVEGISEFLESLTQLQHLNLSHCPKIGEMPDTLGHLSKLQYLNLSFSSYIKCCKETEVLATLTKLKYLNLSSKYCNIQKLPEDLGRFIQLKYLNLSGCWSMIKLPRLFGNLKNLVHLDLSGCRMVDCLDEALVGLSNLQHLNLLGTRIRLLPEDLTRLRYLNLSGLINWLPDTFDHLINHISSRFSNLEHLDLSNNSYSITSLPESICSLRKLHTLNLSKCENLKHIPESIGAIDSLKFLNLNGCCYISEPPQLGGSAVSLPHFVVQSGYDESGSNLVQLESTDPVVLQISKLENVKSVGEAHRIKLVQKQSLVNLKLKWTRDVERFVDERMLLEQLVPPSTLNKLEICGYNGVSFPAWLVGKLPNIEELVLRDMANLEELDTSYSSGEENVIRILKIHDCPMLRMKPLPARASIWDISKSDNVLSSWKECIVSHTNSFSSSSPVTIELSVQHCKVPLHQWRLLQHLSGLLCLSIGSCGDLTGSPETSRYLSSLEVLSLEGHSQEEFPKWLVELTSLRALEIFASNHTGLNENMRKFTKLQSLKLYGCKSMASLPHWLGELASLKELFIWDCGVLRSLPESIQQLTCLQKLEIGNCPELEHIVEPEEQTMKLVHIQEHVCPLPTSLEELEIGKCPGIRSLPEGIQQLTSLKKLEIYFCPELEQWCRLEENQMKLAHIEHKDFNTYR